MSQYEIELFAARGIDGKISSMKNRGAYNGGPYPYGYTISPGTGKLVVNPEEAEVVRTIFEKFSKGEKTAAITDWLNASGIPCSFRTRIVAAPTGWQRPQFDFKHPSAPRALDKGFQGFVLGGFINLIL